MKKFLFGLLIFVLSAVAIFSYGINASAATPTYYTGYSWDIPFDPALPYWFVAESSDLGGMEALVLSNKPFFVKYESGDLYERYKGNYWVYTGTFQDTISTRSATYINGVGSFSMHYDGTVNPGFYNSNTAYGIYLKGDK